MHVEFIAAEGFTDAQVKMLKDERAQLQTDLFKTPDMVRFKKGESASLY